MATTTKALARGAFATSSTTLYTVPASTTTVVSNIVVTNSAASAATFTITLDAVDLFKDVAIAANTTAMFDLKQVLATTKIIAGFAWSLMNCSGFLFFAYLIPFLVLIPLIGLECVVAIIQAFVFTTLCTIYLKDSLNMH